METLKREVEVEVYCKCNKCNKDLGTTLTEDRYGNSVIEVEPCADCLAERYEDGVSAGRDIESA